MAQQHVFVGRSWPILPQYMRVTVGTAAEMLRFREVFARVMVA
jgi:histidinol-phosphate aminotransferase